MAIVGTKAIQVEMNRRYKYDIVYKIYYEWVINAISENLNED